MSGSCHILLRSDSKKKRARFRRACKKQGMTMTGAINLMMTEVIKGKIKFRANMEEEEE